LLDCIICAGDKSIKANLDIFFYPLQKPFVPLLTKTVWRLFSTNFINIGKFTRYNFYGLYAQNRHSQI
jgi:hypothetical protein